jgi:NADH:ubiquinone oxidoreductase subunit 5 (subunit L)/multisubunit Na+/H+ antiporter MnhA subunit
MPFTWISFIVGSAAIIGVPPLNGFVSEWLVYQGLFRAGHAGGGLRVAILAVPALALIGGLALACFAKVAGVVFLGQPRTARPLNAREVGPKLLVPLLALAGACALIGLFPTLVMPALLRAGASIAGEPLTAPSSALASVLIDSRWVSIFGIALASVILVIWVGRYFIVRRRSIRNDETWACGFAHPSPRMQYTASSFAAPLLSIFGALSGVREHRGATVFHTTVDDLVLDRVALPWWERVHRVALRLRPIQQGRLHVYLLYIVATLLVLLAYLVLGPAK